MSNISYLWKKNNNNKIFLKNISLKYLMTNIYRRIFTVSRSCCLTCGTRQWRMLSGSRRGLTRSGRRARTRTWWRRWRRNPRTTSPTTPRTCRWAGTANPSPTGCTSCTASTSPTTARSVATTLTR